MSIGKSSKFGKQIGTLLFILLIDLIVLSCFPEFRFLSKPFVLLFLIYFFVKSSQNKDQPRYLTMLGALIFSLMGDVFLLSDKNSFFIYGLLAFLVAHLLYIYVFTLDFHLRKFRFIVLGLTCSIGLILYKFISPQLGNLAFPVLMYTIVIISMANLAFNRKSKSPGADQLIFYGALFFMFSDSILALRKFCQLHDHFAILVMLTYGIAQLFIVLGQIDMSEDLNQS